ncbi:hypothetical protein LZ518_08425 [Sphingomonas sp. RB56-2]|uniref:Uncharacterized protein n=1 Tax=Sphingomonas brevis TaxID=2908206 RepID=A0ABT0S9S8_9SPHN|nr:hypothetical protein [Sphingomonas brevis]MCL6741154.1 hypothetical protein [Sphingomonas brevis]
MATLLDIANKLADPKLKAACERIIAHPLAFPEAKATARSILVMIDKEAKRRQKASTLPDDRRGSA